MRFLLKGFDYSGFLKLNSFLLIRSFFHYLSLPQKERKVLILASPEFQTSDELGKLITQPRYN